MIKTKFNHKMVLNLEIRVPWILNVQNIVKG